MRTAASLLLELAKESIGKWNLAEAWNMETLTGNHALQGRRAGPGGCGLWAAAQALSWQQEQACGENFLRKEAFSDSLSLTFSPIAK